MLKKFFIILPIVSLLWLLGAELFYSPGESGYLKDQYKNPYGATISQGELVSSNYEVGPVSDGTEIPNISSRLDTGYGGYGFPSFYIKGESLFSVTGRYFYPMNLLINLTIILGLSFGISWLWSRFKKHPKGQEKNRVVSP